MPPLAHQVRLTSPHHYGRHAPPAAVGEFLRLLPPTVKQAVRMGFAGRSISRGRQPAWLAAAADIRFVGYDERGGDTLLCFEAPTFGEAAEELYRERELWPTKPLPEDTSFDLLGDVLTDVAAEAEDSERFDQPLLKRLMRFWRGLEGGFDGAYLSGHRYTEPAPARLTTATIQAAERLYAETPAPQRVRVAGRLDMIWQSRQGFVLKLDDGNDVRGVLVEGDLCDLKDLFNQRVVVHGRAVYRPSGRLLRLDAELIEAGPNESAFWSRIPPPKGRKLDLKQIQQPQTPKTGAAALFGKWPGDETEADLLDALKRMG
jgi:hypothetical protein